MNPFHLPYHLTRRTQAALAAGLTALGLSALPALAQQAPIRDAALKGDLARVKKLVAAKPGLLKTKEANGALCMAAYSGKLPVVQFLAASGSSVNEKDFDGATPLHMAAASASAPIAQFLLGKGAKVNVAKWNGWTPLHEAAASGSAPVAQLLLAKGAKVNAGAGPKAETPYKIAVKYRNSEVAAVLRKKGGR